MSEETQVKIIRVGRRKSKHHGSHGGSWKIAYADFVTAMMAFFMVLWIVGMDSQMKKAIESYFTDPVGSQRAYSNGVSPIASGSSPVSVPRPAVRLAARTAQRQMFDAISMRLRSRMAKMVEETGMGVNVQVYVDAAGLRIDLVESTDGQSCFPFGSAVMKPAAERALRVIGSELRRVPNPLIIEGHTDAAPFGTITYTNWELSADRANAARRVLEAEGVADGRIREVRGMADRQLRIPDRPLDPSNRRIAILLPYVIDGAPTPPLPSELDPSKS
jgi:chemotaxis protein MotB